jgi:hypothetical protein
MSLSTHPVILDTATVLKASAAVTVTANATAIDVGSGFIDGYVVVDISAAATGADNIYEIIIQGGTDSGITTGVRNLARVQLAATGTTGESADNRVVGRLLIPVCNSVVAGVDPTRYMRVRTTVAGTGSPSITYSAYLTKKTHRTM